MDYGVLVQDESESTIYRRISVETMEYLVEGRFCQYFRPDILGDIYMDQRYCPYYDKR